MLRGTQNTITGSTHLVHGQGGQTGIETVGVRCGGWDDGDLAGAAAIYDDPAHLLLEYDGSPFAAASRRSRGSEST